MAQNLSCDLTLSGETPITVAPAFLKASAKSKADVNTRHLVARLLFLAVLSVGLATILAIFDVPLSALVTLLGVIGLGISLALQDIDELILVRVGVPARGLAARHDAREIDAIVAKCGVCYFKASRKAPP